MAASRVIDLNQGVAMIVTDLHGNLDAYTQLRDKFFQYYERDEAQHLVICGDVVHGYGSEEDDASLPILMDIMRLQAEMPPGTVIMLMGNHEMPHVYGIPLSKGHLDFTPRLERALTELDQTPDAPYTRADIQQFLIDLPFFVRTPGGVLITHAGATPAVRDPLEAEKLLNFDHEALLMQGDQLMNENYDLDAMRRNEAYVQKARQLLAVTGVDDPRFADLLRGEIISQTFTDFRFLWEVLFSTNEQQVSVPVYRAITDRFLEAISSQSPHPVRVLIAGHIAADDGFEYVGTQQIRLASYEHARPKERGRYMLLDVTRRVLVASQLESATYPTFD